MRHRASLHSEVGHGRAGTTFLWVWSGIGGGRRQAELGPFARMPASLAGFLIESCIERVRESDIRDVIVLAVLHDCWGDEEGDGNLDALSPSRVCSVKQKH